ncbi:hypothetical protein [Candidatus Carsonella ruddii]|uniref:hypothetical protein n=1 Tax=Carsonella ruddii TaxID=114186 RepID=UPI003D9A56F9
MDFLKKKIFFKNIEFIKKKIKKVLFYNNKNKYFFLYLKKYIKIYKKYKNTFIFYIKNKINIFQKHIIILKCI